MPQGAVIYARFSSDNQSEHSIEDQKRTCRRLADQLGLTVIDTFTDYAISGAKAARPGFQALARRLEQPGVAVVLAESLDRLSRDQEHIAGFYKQTTFRGVRIITVAEGEISEIHIGLKGTMSALFLKELGQKTHRGLEGRVVAGRSAGGLSFGYAIPRRLGADGNLVTGEMVIDEDQAAIVWRIFTAYVGGQSPRAIAKQLNAEGVSGPCGQWTASLILGNATRQTGILRNRLYAGERVWDRQHLTRNPASDKRVARPNPKTAWIRVAVPELRIIDETLWQAAQQRLEAASTAMRAKAGMANTGARLAAARRAPWLLSGLVRCGVCQGPLTVLGAGGRLGCANRRERGTCSNQRSILRDRLLTQVMDGLKHRLLAPELVEEFVRTYAAEVKAANRDRARQVAVVERKRAQADREIRALLDLMKAGHGTPAMVEELRAVEVRRDTLAIEAAAVAEMEPLPVLHPNAAAVYRKRVEELEAALADPETYAAAVEALRSLVDAIIVSPGARRGEVSIALRGDLAAFLHLDEMARGKPGVRGLFGVMGTLVAGARNHLDLLLTG